MNKGLANINNDAFLSLLSQGDREAHEMLFDLYYDKLLHVTLAYVNNRQDAEEIVQDVFIKVWEKRTSIDIKNSINGYLYAVTRNLCLDYLRRKKRKLNVENNMLQSEALVNYNALADNLSSTLIEKELEDQIQFAIEHLPAKCRQVFTKSRVEGLRYREISEELDISMKTVENHMSKALKHMRIYLKEYLPFL